MLDIGQKMWFNIGGIMIFFQKNRILTQIFMQNTQKVFGKYV